MRTRFLGPVLMAAVAALLLAGTSACGGGGDDEPDPSTNEIKAADAISRQFQNGGLTAKDGDCIAQGWVDKTGTKSLIAGGVLTADLAANTKNQDKPSKAIVLAYADAYFACGDYGDKEATTFDKTRPGLINKADFAKCANQVDQKDAKQALIDNLLGKQSDVSAKVQTALVNCAKS